MKIKIIIWVFIITLFLIVSMIWKYLDSFNVPRDQIKDINKIEKSEYAFLTDNLKTNTLKKSIDIDLILDWWPWKDWIPTINKPNFIKISQVSNQRGLWDNTLWISLFNWQEQKFYPYSILYWHEIVNDIIWDKRVSVTFCPLCGTAIVYNREIDWVVRYFGVSGKLYESNLLMYDNINESLWSQSIWEAVVWEDLWKELEVIKSDVMSFAQFKRNYPQWLVLSEDTWYSRNYARTPYWNYEKVEDLYFPVQNTDKKLHQKELMFVLPYKWDSYAFVRSELMKLKEIDYKIWDEILNIEFINWEITASIWDKIIPWYIEMWFSWFAQNPQNDNIWIWE